MLILNQEWSTRHWNVALEGTTLGSWEQCSGSRDLTPGFIPGQHETAGKHAGEVSWWQQKDYQREPSRILANPSWNFVRWPTRPSLSKFPLHCGRASACKVQTTNLFEKIEVIYKVPYIEAKAKHSPEHRLCQYQHPRSASSFLETTPLALDPGQFEKKNTRKQTQSFSLQQTHVHAQLRINLDCIDQDEKVYRCNSNCTRQLQPHAHSNGYSVVISCACSVSMGNSSQPRTRITSNFLCAWLFSRLWGWSTYSTHQRASLHHLQVHSHSSARVCACVCVCVCVCVLIANCTVDSCKPPCMSDSRRMERTAYNFVIIVHLTFKVEILVLELQILTELISRWRSRELYPHLIRKYVFMQPRLVPKSQPQSLHTVSLYFSGITPDHGTHCRLSLHSVCVHAATRNSILVSQMSFFHKSDVEGPWTKEVAKTSLSGLYLCLNSEKGTLDTVKLSYVVFENQFKSPVPSH